MECTGTSSANARAHVVISHHSVRQDQLACVPDMINTISKILLYRLKINVKTIINYQLTITLLCQNII